MRTRIVKPTKEKVFSVINGEGIYFSQSPITSKFQNLNRREALNRPTCKYHTPIELIERVEILKSERQAELEKFSGAIREARQWANALLIKTTPSRYNVA